LGVPRGAEAPTTKLRLFYAIELPDDWRAPLASLQRAQERAAPGYFRWASIESVHLTLVFLGWQPAESLILASEALRRAAVGISAFRLRLGRAGTFGPPRSPRVLWVEAFQPEGRLQQLRDALERELRAASLSFDEKPLAPHITLGRASKNARGRPTLLDVSTSTKPHYVQRAVLFESRLSPRGASYEVRAKAVLQ
jgi:2'-5' RNA ligase